MRPALLLLLCFTPVAAAAPIPETVATHQNTVFKQLWGETFEWRFSKLPTKGKVPKHRVPYSGYIYPDREGGTARALSKYDRAFHGGRSLATSWERHDTTAYKEPGGLFGIFGRQTPYWHGHCNGWTAAAIRHAEPQKTVRRGGVEFTPADIKALLAEIYIYNDTDILAGVDAPLNAGTFHSILANWLGRGSHPIAMEADPSKEKWNYPIYSYSSKYGAHSEHEIEVRTNILFAKDTNDGEYAESPKLNEVKSFHYTLELDARGRIVGGYFHRDSEAIDFIWIPLRPKPAEGPGHERGNPHVDVERVLSIWRESVPSTLRRSWGNVDPASGEPVARFDGHTKPNTRPQSERAVVINGPPVGDDDKEVPIESRRRNEADRRTTPALRVITGAERQELLGPSRQSVVRAAAEFVLEPVPDAAFATEIETDDPPPSPAGD